METNATWTTATGERVRVSYRGELANGSVVISTGNGPFNESATSVELDAITLERDTAATMAQRERDREAAAARNDWMVRMAGRSVRRLAGNCGDLGQQDMFGANKNLFNR